MIYMILVLLGAKLPIDKRNKVRYTRLMHLQRQAHQSGGKQREVHIREGQTTLSTTAEQKEELESITNFVVPQTMRRKGSPAIMAFIRMLTSRDAKLIKYVADRLYEYSDKLQKEADKKSKEGSTRKRLHLDNEPLTCTDAII